MVQSEWFTILRKVRDMLFALPDRLAAKISGEQDPHRVRAMLDGEIEKILTELSRQVAGE